jgi:hypothetical protein
LSKEPPAPTRTIRKRSYKHFDKDQFLQDISDEDWTEVLACKEVDEAVTCFTLKFKRVLNIHAPWIVFQQRKYFKPWISKEVKTMMDQRDDLKTKAVDLSVSNPNNKASEEEIEAWSEYRKLRNLVTNKKKNDEYKYQKEKVVENLENPASTWSTVKKFMNWKSTGTPS